MKVIAKPSFAIRLYAGGLIFIGATSLAMLLGPAFVINAILGMDDGLDSSRSRESLEIYVQQLAESSSLDTAVVTYLFAVSSVVSCIYIVSGTCMLFRRAWVRKPLLCSLGVVILLFTANHLLVAAITGRYLPTLYGVVSYLVVPLTLIYRFTRADARQLFAGKA